MMQRRINVRGIIWRDGKLLAVKHKDDNGKESAHWAVNGGGLDPMETLEDGVRREIKEELGIDVKVGNLLFIQQFLSKRDGYHEELEFFFHIEDTPLFDTINLDATTHGAIELSRAQFIDPKKELLLPKFLSELDIDAVIAGSQPVHISSDL